MVNPKKPSSSKPTTAKSFFTRKRILFWLIALVVIPFAVKSIVLHRLNTQLSEGARQATAGRIQEVRVNFSTTRLLDFLSVAGNLASSLRQTGKPVLSEVRLEKPVFHLVPLGAGVWRLKLDLKGISGSTTNQPVLMTRTEVTQGILYLASGTPDEVRLGDFHLLIAPSAAAPDSQLEYTISGNSPTLQIDLKGSIGQDAHGRWYGNHQFNLDEFSLLLLGYIESNISPLVISGTIHTNGTIRHQAGQLQVESRYSGRDIRFAPEKAAQLPARRALELLNQEPNPQNKSFNFSARTDQPGFQWEEALLGALVR